MDFQALDFMYQCHSVVTIERGIIPALFIGGLAGSVTHCLGMCSPFVLAQVSELPKTNNMISSKALFQQALLPYHLGRITTYAGVGAISAWAMMLLSSFTVFHKISAILLILAGMLFLASAVGKISFFQTCATPRWIMSHLDKFLRLPLVLRGYSLGLLLGFLPCGLLYAATLAAATTADPFLAAAGMLAFGLGTVPALVVVAFGGKKIIQFHPGWAKTAAIVFSLLNSFSLFLMAGGLIS